MIEKDFRTLRKEELQSGMAIWLQGKSFLDTSSIDVNLLLGQVPICGPFLVERVLFQAAAEPRVDLVDPSTGDRRSMMCSWLLVPKEDR